MTPQDIGLPHPAWRKGQWEMVQATADHEGQHQLWIAPTGFGKSLAYMGVAALTGWRTVILTATKSLQDQLMREFGAHDLNAALLEGLNDGKGLIDVRGQSNYLCNAAGDPTTGLGMFFRKGRIYTVRDAPCRRGITCPLREGGCAYYDRVREAARSTVFVTNYDFWMRNAHKMGRVDLLVMDEAHQAPDELADFLSFRLTAEHKRVFKRSFPAGEDVRDWADWAEWSGGRLAEMLERDYDAKVADLKMEVDRMADLLRIGEWVIEHDQHGGVAFDCINPESQGRRVLWGSAKRVLLVSATVNLMTAKALGMDPAQVTVREATTSFPVNRRPVYVVNGAVRLNFRSTEGEKRMWVNLIDRIIDQRQHLKGIIHTTSFERAKYLLIYSRHRSLLRLNSSGDTAATVSAFKSAKVGILVSPSLTTGWDFPDGECRWQIIGKIPFPDLRSKAAKTKNSRNKEWSGYTAAQVIVQASGRGMRSESDWCETFIVDGNFGWWWTANLKFLPKWWQIAVKWVGLAQLPAPIEL